MNINTAMMPGLPVQVIPYADESLLGFLNRLADANGLQEMFLVRRFRAALSEKKFLDSCVAAMPPHWRYAVREMLGTSKRPLPAWNIRGGKFCGKCVQKRKYWRAAWELSLVTSCTRHRVQLRDTCPTCGEQVISGSRKLSCQSCGESFDGVADQPKVAGPAELWFMRELQSRLYEENQGRSSVFRHLNLHDLHWLGFDLWICVSRHHLPAPFRKLPPLSFATLQDVAHCVARLLYKWPLGLHKALKEVRRERKTAEIWDIDKSLGPICNRFFNELPSKRFGFVANAIEVHIKNVWDGPLPPPHQDMFWLLRRGATSVVFKHGKSYVLMPARRLSNLLKLGKLGYKHVKIDGSVVPVVDLQALRFIADDVAKLETLDRATSKLGLPFQFLEYLVDGGLLSIWAPGKIARRRDEAISVRQRAALNELSMGASVIKIDPGLHVSMATLLDYDLKSPKAFLAFMSAIKDGRVAVSGVLHSRGLVVDWVFEYDDIREFLNSIRDPVSIAFQPSKSYQLAALPGHSPYSVDIDSLPREHYGDKLCPC